MYEFDLLLLKVLLLLEQDHPFHLVLGTSLQRYLKDDKQLAAQYHDAVQKSKVALCRYNNYGVFCGICICNKFLGRILIEIFLIYTCNFIVRSCINFSNLRKDVLISPSVAWHIYSIGFWTKMK